MEEKNSLIYKTMNDKGLDKLDIEPLAEPRPSTGEDRRKLEKYYIRLLKPDLNPQNGTLSNKECERQRKWAAQKWTCDVCNATFRISHKWQHKQTKMHKDYMRLTELD